MSRRGLLVGLIPVLLAGTAALTAPAPAMAASGVTDTAVTTYTVNPDKAEIDVTIQISIRNNTPSTKYSYFCGWSMCTRTTSYYYTTTTAWAEKEGGPITATANTGKVKQTQLEGTTNFREIRFTYSPVYYHQTRVVTAKYVIPAAPRSTGGFRAGQAYYDLCAAANGYDSGVAKVVIPDGFSADFYSGSDLKLESDKNGFQTYTSGSVTEPYRFWSCAQGSNPAKLKTSALTTPTQAFSLLAWPEDSHWASLVGKNVTDDAAALESLTGLKMPGGSITVREAGAAQLGAYVGSYNSKTHTVTVAEDGDPATVAHELAHIWFNGDMLSATWMDEGFAGYSEKVAGKGNYLPCTDPGRYPGAGSPNLTVWSYVDIKSTTQEEQAVTWNYDASCWLVTSLADAMGPARFKAVLGAASKGEIAYLGAGPAEADPNGGLPISAKTLLDLIDERGLVPAGVKDLDEGQKLFTDYGILAPSDLAKRSLARAAYHKLTTAAGMWKMPIVIRDPMATWDFAAANEAMAAATQIIDLRDQTVKSLTGFSLDGSQIQTKFESAKTKADLVALADLAKKEADAATKVAQAKQLNDASRSLLQTVGLLGTDVATPLAAANAALKAVKPADATTSAQQVIDAINKSGDQGLMRLGALVGLLLALLLLVLFIAWRRRRGKVALAAPALATIDGTVLPPPVDGATAVWTAPPAPTFDPTLLPPAAPPNYIPADSTAVAPPPAPPVAPAPPDEGGTVAG
jgi:hypothetical protein